MFPFDKKIEFPPRKYDLLTFGELLVDMISEEYGGSGDTYHRFFGGSPANIAMNARRLGIVSQMVSAVGKDALGDFLLRHVEALGMDNDHIRRVDHATSMVLIPRSQGTPVPIFYREADYHLVYDGMLDSLLKQTKILHFSCWPVSRNPARKTLDKAITTVRNNGGLVCFDPNYHPALWKNGEDGIPLVKEMIGKVDIIKPSEDDAVRIFGPDTHERQLEKFLLLGPKLVIMTLGKYGAMVSNGTATVKYASMATEVVDTTGAGDAFWGGFYAAIVRGFALEGALRAGFAASAYKLGCVGAIANLPSLDNLCMQFGLHPE